ncbi:pilus assembly protein [Hyalangium rubrum]|uniref:Pilus assembly protein n=1 Tax=Hyalangium rubrum TaxID=3103134 RepID=A0ABU5H080_9BACT|nr:pilus assembly protein [Hyalangium sp. s54d21]MDY7226183.1 pilus assembly protein [Hyalangium sp. s54d21]
MQDRTHRGQTLVLFALTLLLLTLMVCVTLSIGVKAKEKMELETAADTAAYSQAVATARAFNSIALMNRALMSHMVAMTGVESLISWSGYYRASLHAAKTAYETPKDGYKAIAAASCPCAPKSSRCARLCRCSRQAIQDINNTQDRLMRADDRAEQVFRVWDARAGEEALSLQLSSIHEDQLETFAGLKVAMDLSPRSERYAPIAPAIAGDIGAEVSALQASATVNGRELGNDCKGPGAVCQRRDADKKSHFVWASTGARGHAFVTGREGGAALIRRKVIQSMPANELVRLTDEGSGYFSGSKSHTGTVDGGAVYGDDHGQVTVVFRRARSPCPTFPPTTEEADAHVRSDDSKHNTDEHKWTGGEDPNRRRQMHTLGDCTKCPGVWPSHMDYNYSRVANTTDLFGQPKNYAVLQRDYTQRPPDPWNLFFRFRFNPSGEGTTFDNRALRLTDGTNISRAVALSSGIAYYHRVGADERWKEPPNFLNPFWRATLVGADVDQPRDVPDILSTLGATGTPARDVADALAKQGYQAW